MGFKLNLDTFQDIALKRNIQKDGKAQQLFTSEVARLSDEYVPFDNGPLKNTKKVKDHSIEYVQPYAQYQWHGVVMAGNPRKPTNKPLHYGNGPLRGKEWTNRMWADRGQEIVQSIANFVGGRSR